MSRSPEKRTARRIALAGVAFVSTLVLAACGGGSSTGSGSTAAGDAGASGLNQAGTLTVGMNLQFKPEMYLDDAGKPAGYDVELLTKLATDLGVKLDIQNLDFNGLIPGLQSKKFDMVSVGLTATDARKQVIDFSREYVPYTSVLAVKQGDTTAATVDAYNTPSMVITALQGSSGEQLAKKTFPNAQVKSFADQNAALLEVSTGRANGSVLEDYILAQYQKANPNQVAKAALPKPLDLGYGSWAVQKGNSVLSAKLNTFLCKAQGDGTLKSTYTSVFGVDDFPEMPGGC
ncbi:transporter substrate-binding domain-containing protein [Umezawaea sp. Da 62-37]|uniref:transporter substrate-binding domain-containing protein n=1 Tax=Umezawaea sp. Da 62-37 TaxID=3075927 RepID=UPI0028F6DDDD|nr:transporter substrate-binding domain-containing protein [Umezawaea sp. Da 62-37]WNV85646.1 transporter substrate-binding domain-containing protein [Umezawaea sp. Da 62-37]